MFGALGDHEALRAPDGSNDGVTPEACAWGKGGKRIRDADRPSPPLASRWISRENAGATWLAPRARCVEAETPSVVDWRGYECSVECPTGGTLNRGNVVANQLLDPVL